MFNFLNHNDGASPIRVTANPVPSQGMFAPQPGGTMQAFGRGGMFGGSPGLDWRSGVVAALSGLVGQNNPGLASSMMGMVGQHLQDRQQQFAQARGPFQVPTLNYSVPQPLSALGQFNYGGNY